MTIATGVRASGLDKRHDTVTLRGVSYRPPERPPKGKWARHIHEFRRSHRLSATAAFEAWREGLGLGPKSRSAYLRIDTGERQQLKPEEETYLASILGWPPEEEPEPAVVDQTALVAALNRQSEAIEALVGEMRLSRGSRDVRDEELMRLVASLVPREPPAGDERDARVGTSP